MLLFSPRAFLILSNMWVPLLSVLIGQFVDIDNNAKLAGTQNQIVLTDLCLNTMWMLYPKIKLTMNLYD